MSSQQELANPTLRGEKKKGFDSLVQNEKVFGQDHHGRSSNLQRNGVQFFVTERCLKSAWRLMARARKIGHTLHRMTPLPWKQSHTVLNSRNVRVVPGKFSSPEIFHTSACCESKHPSFGQDRFIRSVSGADTKSRSHKQINRKPPPCQHTLVH